MAVWLLLNLFWHPVIVWTTSHTPCKALLATLGYLSNSPRDLGTPGNVWDVCGVCEGCLAFGTNASGATRQDLLNKLGH